MHYFRQNILADFMSKYCLLSIQLTSACIYTPQHTNFGCFVCACCYFRIFCLTLYTFKAAPLKFFHHAFNSGATLLCIDDFSHKIVSHRAAKKILIRGQGLAVKGVSKFKLT